MKTLLFVLMLIPSLAWACDGECQNGEPPPPNCHTFPSGQTYCCYYVCFPGGYTYCFCGPASSSIELFTPEGLVAKRILEGEEKA